MKQWEIRGVTVKGPGADALDNAIAEEERRLAPGRQLRAMARRMLSAFLGDQEQRAANGGRVRPRPEDVATFDMEWDGRSFRCRVEPLRDAEGSIRALVGVAVDAEHAIEHEEADTGAAVTRAGGPNRSPITFRGVSARTKRPHRATTGAPE